MSITSEKGKYSSSAPVAVIILAGKTGSGKSSLIKLLGGRDLLGDEPVVDGGLDSCNFRKLPPMLWYTINIFISGTQSPTVYVTMINNRKILLLDTPGFDDSAVGNLEVLNEIVANLYTFALERQEFETQGVIFLHDISENRFAGSQRKTLEILTALCGPKGLKNCIIGTTMWDPWGTARFRNEETREKDFLRSYWKGILKTTRIPENDRNAVVGIVSDILARPPVLLQVQEEMMKPPHTLEATAAGKIAIPEGRAEAEQLRREFEDQQRVFREDREKLQAEFERETEEIRKQSERERAKQEVEHRRIKEERKRHEEEQGRRHRDEIRNLDAEYRRRIEEDENRRRAEEKQRQEMEITRWREFIKQQQENADFAEEERERRYEEERLRLEEEASKAREREDERIRLLMAEFGKAAETPPKPKWWELVVGIAVAIFESFF